MKREQIRNAIINNSIEWRKHALIRIFERGITRAEIKDALLHGEIIEEYTDDKPYPSALFFMIVGGKPLHVVAALDETTPTLYIVTAYMPTLDKFERDYKTRKK